MKRPQQAPPSALPGTSPVNGGGRRDANVASPSPVLILSLSKDGGSGPRSGSKGAVGTNKFIPTPANPTHTTHLPSPDRAVRTDRVEVVLIDAARAGTDPGARWQRREGSCAAIAAHERSAKETSAAGMGLTALPMAVRAIHLSSQATARLSESSGRPASNERAILRRARPWRTLYSHAERLALPTASTLDAPGPVTSGRD